MMTDNKYNGFYESVKRFILNTKLADENNLQGLSVNKINDLERHYGLTFPLALKTFMLFFGETFKVKKTDGVLMFTQKEIINAMSFAKKNNIIEYISDKRGVQDSEWKEGKKVIHHLDERFDMNKLLFIGDHDRWQLHPFIDCREENPIIHFLNSIYKEDTIVDEFDFRYSNFKYKMTFVSFIRERLFLAIRSLFYLTESSYTDDDFTLVEKQEIEKYLQTALLWSPYYAEHFKKYTIAFQRGFDIQSIRHIFYKQTDVKAQETGIVMTIDEFEWAFIEHLRGLGIDI